jgi:hypothetical protein
MILFYLYRPKTCIRFCGISALRTNRSYSTASNPPLRKASISIPASLTVPSERLPMKTYRTRPVRVATKTNKPGVINNPETATLLHWITNYPQMRRPDKAAMWFSRMRFPVEELAEVHALGFETLATALGYRQPLKLESTPYIVSITPNTGQLVSIEQTNKAA